MHFWRWFESRAFLLLMLVLPAAGCNRPEETTAAPSAAVKKRPARRPKSDADRSDQTPIVDSAAETAGAGARRDPEPQPNPDPPQRIVRPALKVPQYDDRKIGEMGIHRYESKHLVLYTDIDPQRARELPPLMDQAYAAWEEYFGPLPPDPDGTVFQMVGHIMADRDLFRQAGILNEEVPNFAHGINRRQLFWMVDQSSDYYRRHLMLHEGTHCFMMALPNPSNNFVWYMEGMAELFGTHALDERGVARFRVLPAAREEVEGLGRILLVEDEVRVKGPRTIAQVTQLEPSDYFKNDAYAWSWALCAFLDGHPKYRERFRRAGTVVTAGGKAEIDLAETFRSDWNDLSAEWLVFAGNLCHGYDIERTLLDLTIGKPLQGARREVETAADRGWQSSGILVERGKSYRISARGRFVLATEPKPWESEPQGVSIRYHAGLPLGMLVAAINSPAPLSKPPYASMLTILPIGRAQVFMAPVSGTLYFRVNDYWNELSDNSGNVQVTIEEDGERGASAPR